MSKYDKSSFDNAAKGPWLAANAPTKDDKSDKKLVIFPISEVKPLNNANNPS